MQTITVNVEKIPRIDQADALAADLRLLVGALSNTVGEITLDRIAAWMHVQAGLDSPSSDQITRFAERAQRLADQTGTTLMLTISPPPGHANVSAALGTWASLPVDGHVFQIHPSGDASYLQMFLHATVSRSAS